MITKAEMELRLREAVALVESPLDDSPERCPQCFAQEKKERRTRLAKLLHGIEDKVWRLAARPPRKPKGGA